MIMAVAEIAGKNAWLKRLRHQPGSIVYEAGWGRRFRLPDFCHGRASSPWQKSSRIGNAGETACATTANQQFAAQMGQAFSLPCLSHDHGGISHTPC
ncbi:MAG TPA: hypothetical protein VNV86_09795 [Candidatus Acidoferrum sp.]|nr:hypothetical protein [Candidatus Acidoferrum sp.]